MLPYLFQVAVVVFLPLLFIASLWRARESDRCRWLLKALYTGIFLAYMFALGRWDFSSVYLRYVLGVSYLAAAIKSFLAAKNRPFIARDDPTPKWRAYGASVALLVFFAGFLVWAVRGYFYDDQPVALKLPLRNGAFYVGQGGNSVGLNYHNRNRSQRYALDIVALNEFGSRARGLYPKDLTRYAIFGQPVYSPCAGRIEAAVDRFPDQIPPNADRRNASGNHVVVSCNEIFVLLAHLQAGSVRVQQGQSVNTDDQVGVVGNSGNTSEPHLHVHAVSNDSGDILSGKGVPLLFDAVFAVRNTIL